MRKITRIHLAECGWREAFYPGTTVHLCDPRTRRPVHTVFNMENTGGKTTFLSLVFSCFDTSERRFLKTLIRPNQRFGDYFADVPAFVIVEWDLDDDQHSLLDDRRLVTGQIVVPLGQGTREHERIYFVFRARPGLTLDDLPVAGLAGAQTRRLRSRSEIQQWLYEMRAAHPGNFQTYDNQGQWKRKLAEEKVDHELLAAQVDFNRAEGGIDEFLRFRSEEEFVRKFLGMTLSDEECANVRQELVDHIDKLRDRPRLTRRRRMLERLKECFDPFAEVAEKAAAAAQTRDHAAAEAAGLHAALGNRADQLERDAEEAASRAEQCDRLRLAARRQKEDAVREIASARLEAARRRERSAIRAVEDAKRRVEETATDRRQLDAAKARREILRLEGRRDELNAAIADADRDLEPRRRNLRVLGGRFRATLHLVAEQGEVRAGQAREAARAKREAITALKHTRESELEAATAASRNEAAAREGIRQAEAAEQRLVADGVLGEGESAQAAARRHAHAAADETGRAERLTAEIAERQATVAGFEEQCGALRTEAAGIAGSLKPLQDELRLGEERRASLSRDSVILRVAGENEIDPDADAVTRMLHAERTKLTQALRNAERRLEILEADRESLEQNGLASIDKDARLVADHLRSLGVRDSQPYAVWLSEVLPDASQIRAFAARDPARFTGVAVFTRDGIERARALLTESLPLTRPVVVALAEDTAEGGNDGRIVLPVDKAAAYDRGAAEELRRQLDQNAEALVEENAGRQGNIDELDDALFRLGRWRERFGDGRLLAQRTHIAECEKRRDAAADEADVLVRRIRELREEIDRLQQRARQSELGSAASADRADRAREHAEAHEDRLDDLRRTASEAHEAAAMARTAMTAAEAKIERARDDAVRADREAEAAERRASALRTEADAIEFAEDLAMPAEPLRLDDLRTRYNQRREALRALSSHELGPLEGRLAELKRNLKERIADYNTNYGGLDLAEIETLAGREDLAEAIETAQRAEATARQEEMDSVAELRVAKEDFKRREAEAAAIGGGLPKLVALGDDALLAHEREAAGVRQKAEVDETDAAEAFQAAAERRDHAHRAEQALRQHAAALQDMLGNVPAKQEPFDLQDEGRIDAQVRGAIARLRTSNEALALAKSEVYRAYDDVRRLVSDADFAALEQEHEVRANLIQNDAEAAADSAVLTQRLIEDRLRTIAHDLAKMDEDLEACISELQRLLASAIHILRAITRRGRIPDHVPRFGGQQVFQMTADFARVPQEQRRDILAGYIDDLVSDDRIPERGHDIAADLVQRVVRAMGRSVLGIRLLKPKGEGVTEHMPIDKVALSGGELLTAAMMIYLVLARLRAETRLGGGSDGGILILDNPFGQANKSLLLQTQIGLADAMGIQLFFTTGLQDTSALGEFEHLVRLRRAKRGAKSGRIIVEAARFMINKDTGRHIEVVDPAREAAE